MLDLKWVLTIASFLAAMTIAGAFWVGVLAARRLRDWGEGRRALEEGGHTPLALAAGAVVDDPASRRVREQVAARLASGVRADPGVRALSAPRPPQDVSLQTVREGDVISIAAGERGVDGDYIIDGIVRLRQGSHQRAVLVASDGSREVWLVGADDESRFIFAEPVLGHGLFGEPPRRVEIGGASYGLEQRGQASAACLGDHRRPSASRVAVYRYAGSSRDLLWVERWGDEVLVGKGLPVRSSDVSFLPGS